MRRVHWALAGVTGVLFAGLMSGMVLSAANDINPVAVATDTTAGQFIQCHTPRPEICYEVYRPVCATRDAGMRCLTEPCPAAEQATYANDCKACADPAVLGFKSGGEC